MFTALYYRAQPKHPSVAALAPRLLYRSDKLHRYKSYPRGTRLFPRLFRTLTLSRICITRRPRAKKITADRLSDMLKVPSRTSHPAGNSRISEQSNGSVIRLSRFVDKILPSSWWIWSVHRTEGNAMEGLNYDERISGKCTGADRTLRARE